MKTLRELLGKKFYDRIVNEFGGKRIWVPKNGNLGYRDSEYLGQRNDKIINLWQQGRPVKEIAESFSLSTKRVYHILKSNRQNVVEKKSKSLETAGILP
jgi:Mor family transcriptional regulator